MLDLVGLFEGDGHRVIRAGEGEFKTLCPFHSEKTPSCTISTRAERPFFHCFGCGASGDDVDYLVRARGLTKADAMKAARGDGPVPTGSRRQEPKPAAKPAAPKWLAKLPGNHTSRHVYRSARGNVRFVIQRYDIEGKKVIVPYTRARKGQERGWVKALAIREDRPLYRLRELLETPPERMVMVVEGEKCADAVADASSRAVVTAWAGGTGAWKKTDWSPLHGRRVMLVADGDEPGRRCMDEIAEALGEHCPEIRMVRPPLAPDGEKARDIADEIAGGTDIRTWLAEHTARPEADAKPPEESPPPAGDEPAWSSVVNVERLTRWERFRPVELMPDGALTIEISSGDVVYTRQELMRVVTLLALCSDLGWWQTIVPDGLRGQNLGLIVDALYELADR